jgi:ATP-binding cassette subfamily B protein
MSEDAAPEKSPAAQTRATMVGRMGAAGMPVERSKDFKTTTRRLAARLRPARAGLITVVVLAVTSVTLFVLGPKILGHATDIIIDGIRAHRINYGELHRVLYLAACPISSPMCWQGSSNARCTGCGPTSKKS